MIDPEAMVRRAAMFAVSGAEDVIQTDNLLPWLHDPDPEVRRMCSAALEKRGLKPEYIRLANLITDPNWQVRVSVLDNLDDAEDLDAGAWLRRLSHDVSPAVRAAAIRAACENSTVDLSDRLDQMARDDPSPTVSELARHYLEQSKVNSLSRPQ
jgi:HEAT repeat protein